jgi:hypothetical protein
MARSRSSSGWRGRTPPGDTGGSRVSWPRFTSGSHLRASGPSFDAMEWSPPRRALDRPGASSSAARRHRRWLGDFFTVDTVLQRRLYVLFLHRGRRPTGLGDRSHDQPDWNVGGPTRSQSDHSACRSCLPCQVLGAGPRRQVHIQLRRGLSLRRKQNNLHAGAFRWHDSPRVP